MSDRRRRSGLKMRETANVGGRDRLRSGCLQALEFILPQLLGQFGLQNRVGARGATAQVGVQDRFQMEAGRGQKPFGDAADLLAVLKRAWGMESNRLGQVAGPTGCKLSVQSRSLRAEHLANVLGERR